MAADIQTVSSRPPQQNKYDPKQTLIEGIWSAPTSASIGVASTAALAANPKRIAALFVNTSSWNISLAGADGTAVLNSGITLPPYGSFYMQKGDLFFSTLAFNAIAGGAASNLAIQEITS